MGNLKGKITEFLGQWTNDRDTEAQGRAQQKDPQQKNPEDPSVEQEKERVRREHGDVSR
jgi:uncharacterized protein YjbJ (UPF0337 family)